MKRLIPIILIIALASCKNGQQGQSSDQDSLAFFKAEKKELKQAFTAFRIGEVRPAGWIKSQMERDVTQGLVAYFDKLTPEEMTDDLWGSTRRGKVPDSLKSSWRKDLMWWRGEQQGYWWDGLLRNAFLTDNKEAMEKMKKIIEHLISTQDTDGYIGIYKAECRYSNEDGNGELWTQHQGTWVLLTWYDITGDEKALTAVKKSVDCTMRAFNATAKNPFNTELYGGASHGLMYSENVAWLYRITKEIKYRDYAVWLYQAYCESKRFDNDIHYSFLKDSSYNFIGHSAHSFEHLRPLMNSWYLTGAPELGILYKNYITKLDKVILPSGAGFGFENMWSLIADPDSTPVEYCDITELQLSSTFASLMTGATYWSNMTEKLFFNAAQGARLPDCKAVTYCKSDNCNHLDGKLLGYHKKAYAGEEDSRYKYSPTHNDVAECCAPQATRCYPYYVSNMWMRTDKGVVAQLFGPCILNTKINGVKIQIEEVTDFPFEDKITFQINPEQEGEFEVMIRIPDWGSSNVIIADGADIKNENGFCLLNKKWKKGDQINISFKPEIIVRKANNGESYLQRGELVYALNIPSTDKKIKEWPVKGFYDQYFMAQKGFDYNLAFDGSAGNAFGFTLATTKAGDNRWINSPVMLKGKMINGKGEKKEVTLVPMGSTILRKVTFKVK
jgi:uncharacterized protein